MKVFILTISSIFLIGCANNSPKPNDMTKGVFNFDIMEGFYVKETPMDWQYRNSPIETPFVSRVNDRNLTIFGTIIFRESWENAQAKVKMISNNETTRYGSWQVFNCKDKSKDLNGTIKQSAGFDGDSFMYKKGFFVNKNCAYIKVEKEKIKKR